MLILMRSHGTSGRRLKSFERSVYYIVRSIHLIVVARPWYWKKPFIFFYSIGWTFILIPPLKVMVNSFNTFWATPFSANTTYPNLTNFPESLSLTALLWRNMKQTGPRDWKMLRRLLYMRSWSRWPGMGPTISCWSCGYRGSCSGFRALNLYPAIRAVSGTRTLGVEAFFGSGL